MTLTAGIHDGVAHADYHGDCANGLIPSLSASIARLLVNKSPAHARAAHPVLNPNLEPVDTDKFDLGTAFHALFLQGEDIVAVCDAADWRTKDAKDFKADARDQGRIPLLRDQADRVQAMVEAAQAQLRQHHARPPLFADGNPEQTLVWEDDHGVVCRARLDWLRDDYTVIDDLKSTSASADPRKWDRTLYGMGADLQVAFYIRGVERLTGIRPIFRYAVIETYPPYALSVVDLAPAALALAESKTQDAIDRWAVCLEQNFWPAYPSQVASIELPTWEELRWLDKQQEEAA